MINARNTYPTMANGGFDDAEIGAMFDELNRLRRWKEEATEVLIHWDAVADRFDLSAHLGQYSADAVGIEIDRLREKLT